jgi:hypothetical protein
MKRILLAIGIVAVSLPAHAISRYSTPGLSCSRVQAILQSEGSAILRYPSPRNSQLTLYDLYASNTSHCLNGEVAKPAFVPTSDNSQCRVRRCQSRSNQGDR